MTNEATPSVPSLIDNKAGAYSILPGGPVYCAGVLPHAGFEVVRVLLRPQPTATCPRNCEIKSTCLYRTTVRALRFLDSCRACHCESQERVHILAIHIRLGLLS